MIYSEVLPRGRIDIPVEVREALGLKPGDKLRYEIDGDRVVLSKGGNEEDHGDDLMTNEELKPIIDAALADDRPTLSADEAFAEIRAHIAVVAGRADAA